MPTSSSSSPASASARRFEICSCARIMSTNWSPTRMTGLSAFIALWKTIETLRQRNRRRSSALFPTRSSPRKRTLPPTTRAGGRRIWRTAFATVVLPQPDSPARPTISPARISRSTPSTARTGPSPTAYSTASCRSSSSVASRVRATGVSSTSAVTRPPPHASRAAPPRARGAIAGAACARSGAAGSRPRRCRRAGARARGR